MEKMFTLKGSRLPAADVKNIIFVVRPRLELMDIISENVLRYLSELLFGPKEVNPSHGFKCPELFIVNPFSCQYLGKWSFGKTGTGTEEYNEEKWETCDIVQTV